MCRQLAQTQSTLSSLLKFTVNSTILFYCRNSNNNNNNNKKDKYNGNNDTKNSDEVSWFIFNLHALKNKLFQL